MSLVRLPPEVAQLQHRIQQGMQNPAHIDRNTIINDTARLLSGLLALAEQPSPEVASLETVAALEASLEARIDALMAEGNSLTTERDELRLRVNALTNELDASDTVIGDLRQQITELRTINVALARTPPVIAPAIPPQVPLAPQVPQPVREHEREKLPDPEKFNGTDRTKLRGFLAQLRVKAALYPTDQARLRLAFSLLSGDALDLVMPYLREDTTINLTDLSALTTILENAYGNPNKVADAEQKLNSIQQGTRDFSSYYAEFQRYAAEVEWNEAAKLAALKRGLSYRMKQDFMAVEVEPTTVDGYVRTCNRLDTKRRALQNEPAHTRPANSAYSTQRQTSAAPANAKAPLPPRSTPTTIPTQNSATAPAAATSTATGTQAGPMDLSANRRRLSPEERAKRMAEGRCRYCGGLGHFAVNCPTAPRRLAAAEASVTVTASAPGDPAGAPVN